MTNLLQQEISCGDGDRAAKIIQGALGIESDDVANYCFPKTWPEDREQRARIIGDWLQQDVLYYGFNPGAPCS
jgi:cytosine/adenosine deaminase-related metal-dependent hydrolase